MRSFGRDLAKTPAKLVEDPELIADRIIAFADIVGQENVIAGTDRGLGDRVHPQIAWPSSAPCATALRSRARSCEAEFKNAYGWTLQLLSQA